MPVTNEDIVTRIEAASASYSSTFDKGHLALPPAKKYLLLTCMDARIDPARAFGIELGDAHVIRNVRSSPRPSSHYYSLHFGLVVIRPRWLTFLYKQNLGRRINQRRPPQHHHQPAASSHGSHRHRQAYRLRHVDVQE